MDKFPDKNYVYIGIVCIATYAIYLTFQYIITAGQMGVPLDDTWIHFQFADNFSKGNFFQFNAGEYTAGTTSPLYVIVLGIFSFIIKNFIINSIFLSALFHFLSCIFIYRISLRIFSSDESPLMKIKSKQLTPETVSLITALLTVLNGRFAWSGLSGMETTMFTFFCITGVYQHILNLKKHRFSLFPAILFSLATVSRPEGFLLFGLYLTDTLMNLIKDKTLSKYLPKLILSVIIFSAVTFPYMIFSYNISGHFFPNTFRGQGGEFNLIPNFEYIGISLKYFFNDNLIVAVLYISTVIYYVYSIKKYFTEFRYLNLVFLWVIFLPLISSILIPNYRHHVRYMIPLLPFINLISMFGVTEITASGSFKKIKDFILKRKFNIAVILIFSLSNYFIFAAALGLNTDNINNQQVKIANWIHDNTGRDITLAVNDIGAIGFINKNRIVDMAGLITPEILRYRTYNWKDNLDSINYLLKKNNVGYIIIYDEWFKEYLNENRQNLTFITSAYIDNNTICGGQEMKIYKTNFKEK